MRICIAREYGLIGYLDYDGYFAYPTPVACLRRTRGNANITNLRLYPALCLHSGLCFRNRRYGRGMRWV